MNSKRSRIIFAFCLVVTAIVASSGWLDQQGYRYTEAGLQRALVTFGISRALNGVISVAQGTEVAIEPVGIGMTFAPGQILDPINDLVERFSTVVLVAGTAFGAQHVLLDVTASGFFAWVFMLTILVALLSFMLWDRLSPGFQQLVMRMTITLVVLRLATPVFAITGELFYQQFLEPQYQQSSEQLRLTTEQLNLLNQETTAGVGEASQDKSFIDSARDWVQNAGSALDWRSHLAEFSKAAEAASEHAIRLTVVFVFQTVLLPVFAMWLTYRLSRHCLTRNY